MSIALRRNHSQQALSMVELLIGMALGLFLMAAILQLFLGNNRIYRFQEGLSSVQPNARAASEFLARDIRMGGFTGCHPGLPIANVLNDPDTRWWTNFTAGGVIGYDGSQPFTGQPFGTEVGQRVPGTDAIVLLGAGRQGYSIVTQNPIDETFTLDNLHQLSTGSILVAGNAKRISVFQLTYIDTFAQTISDNTDQDYDPDSILLDFTPIAYYVSHGDHGRSLFRIALEPGTSAPQAYELVEEVEDLQIHYGIDTTQDGQVDAVYPDASAIVDPDY